MQRALSFDQESVRKILKGAWHSLLVTVGLLVLNTLLELANQVHIQDPAISAIFTYAAQNLYNIGRQFLKGV